MAETRETSDGRIYTIVPLPKHRQYFNRNITGPPKRVTTTRVLTGGKKFLRNKDIVEMRKKGMTYRAIADVVGLAQERVRQILAKEERKQKYRDKVREDYNRRVREYLEIVHGR